MFPWNRQGYWPERVSLYRVTVILVQCYVRDNKIMEDQVVGTGWHPPRQAIKSPTSTDFTAGSLSRLSPAEDNNDVLPELARLALATSRNMQSTAVFKYWASIDGNGSLADSKTANQLHLAVDCCSVVHDVHIKMREAARTMAHWKVSSPAGTKTTTGLRSRAMHGAAAYISNCTDS